MRILPQSRRRGFTLIELMVAMAITTIIVSVLVSVTAIAIDTWTRSRSEVRAARQAKAMVDTMARDFEALVSRRGNDVEWLYAQASNRLLGPASMQSSNASELIFYTAATDRYAGDPANDQGGDVSCVSYQLQFQDPIEGRETDFSTFALYRLLVNPDDTYQNLLGEADLQTAFSSYRGRLTEVENFVCENVYQFTVTFNIEVTRPGGGSGLTKTTVPVSLGSTSSAQVDEFRITGSGIDLPSSPSSLATLTELKAGRLVSVQVSLTVLTDIGMDQARRRTFTEEQKAEFLAKNSFQYSKLIELPGM